MTQQLEDQDLSGICQICDEEIPIDYFLDPGDIVTCEECDSDYILKSLHPVKLFLLEEDDEDEDDDYFDEEGFYRDDD